MVVRSFGVDASLVWTERITGSRMWNPSASTSPNDKVCAVVSIPSVQPVMHCPPTDCSSTLLLSLCMCGPSTSMLAVWFISTQHSALKRTYSSGKAIIVEGNEITTLVIHTMSSMNLALT